MTPGASVRSLLAAFVATLIPAGDVVAAARAAHGKEEGPAFVAFGDTRAPVTAEDAARALATVIPWGDYEGQPPGGAAGAAAPDQPAQAPPVSPELAAQIRPAYEQALKAYKEQLAKLDPKDTDTRAAIEQAIAQTEAGLAYIDGKAPAPGQPGGAGGAGGGQPKGLKRPAVGNGVPGFDVALANVKRFLADNASAEAVAAFRASEDAKDAAWASRAAAGALLVKKPLAAVAALLRAHELEPANPTHLVSLAAVSTRLGMPRHALALLARAESMPGPLDAPLGVPGRAVLLVNRGHALGLLGRLPEAEAALREAVRLAPQLAEARLNLSHVLYRQDDKTKKAEAVRYYAVARRRTIVTPKDAASPPPAPAEEPPPPAEEPAEGAAALSAEQLDRVADRVRAGRPPAAAVFDMSRGKSQTLPSFKIPRTVAEAAAMDATLKKFKADLMARSAGYARRQGEVWDRMMRRERSGDVPPASAARAHAVFWYISHAETDPSLRAAYATLHKANFDTGVGSFGGQLTNPYASHELMKKHDAILESDMRFPAKCAAMRAATEPYHGTWQGPIRNLYNEVGQYSQKEFRYQTALAANLADPLYHEYAVLQIKQQRIARFFEVLGPAIIVTNWCKHHASSWRFPGAEVPADPTADGDAPDADACPHALKGNYKVKASLGPVEVSGNCEKVAVELSAGEWVKLFGEVEYEFDGEYSFFVGVAGEAAIPGAAVSPEAATKSGLFIKLNAQGQVEDFGFKRTQAAGITAGTPVVSVGYEEELEFEYGLMSTFAGP